MARKCLPLLLAPLPAPGRLRAPAGGPQDDGTLDLVATTYPVYLFAAEVTRGAENVTLTLMIDQPISASTTTPLTVKDMKALERADGILLSGAGLEEAMEDALASRLRHPPQIDCSQDITLLEGGGKRPPPRGGASSPRRPRARGRPPRLDGPQPGLPDDPDPWPMAWPSWTRTRPPSTPATPSWRWTRSSRPTR